MSAEVQTLIEGRVTLHLGDVLTVLRTMRDKSIDCVVTSPPYWGLRDYGVEGQIGLEPTLGQHLDVMVAVFDEVKRVLKPSGTCWVNYGDCYATAPNGRSAADTKAAGNDDRTFRDKPFSTVGPVCAEGSPSTITRGSNSSNKQSSPPSAYRIMAGGYMKTKDLCMVPNRFAIAMQDAGWWVRSEIIWAKPNPMPESVKDRPAGAHEKIWLFTKSGKKTRWRARDTNEWSDDPDESERLPAPSEEFPDATVPRWQAFDYYYEADAVTQPVSKNTHARLSQDVMNQVGSARANGGKKTNGNMKAVARKHKNLDRDKPHSFHKARIKDNDSFNSALALPVTERNLRNYEPAPVDVWNIPTASFSEAHFATFPPELAERCILAGCPKGGVVLDPFGGAGTTGLVAARHSRKAVLIELNPEYAALAVERIKRDWAPNTSSRKVEDMDAVSGMVSLFSGDV